MQLLLEQNRVMNLTGAALSCRDILAAPWHLQSISEGGFAQATRQLRIAVLAPDTLV